MDEDEARKIAEDEVNETLFFRRVSLANVSSDVTDLKLIVAGLLENARLSPEEAKQSALKLQERMVSDKAAATTKSRKEADEHLRAIKNRVRNIIVKNLVPYGQDGTKITWSNKVLNLLDERLKDVPNRWLSLDDEALKLDVLEEFRGKELWYAEGRTQLEISVRLR